MRIGRALPVQDDYARKWIIPDGYEWYFCIIPRYAKVGPAPFKWRQWVWLQWVWCQDIVILADGTSLPNREWCQKAQKGRFITMFDEFTIPCSTSTPSDS
jgi:hypothetical protein